IDPTLVPSVQPLQMIIFGEDPALRAIALDALDDPAHARERAAPRLVAGMKTVPSDAEKREAAEQVFAMGFAAVTPLRGMLTHRDPLNRRLAAETLARFGPQ